MSRRLFSLCADDLICCRTGYPGPVTTRCPLPTLPRCPLPQSRRSLPGQWHLVCCNRTSTPAASKVPLQPRLEPHLPCKQCQVECIQRNVGVAGTLIALLHLRHQGSCQRPQGDNASTSEQMRAREQLASAEPCVEGTLNGKEHTTTQQDAAPPEVLVTVAACYKVLALLQARNRRGWTAACQQLAHAAQHDNCWLFG